MKARLAPILLLALLWALPATATTVFDLTLSEMVEASSYVVHAVVQRTEVKNLGSDEAPRIVTDTTFNVVRVLKGTANGPTFVLSQVGGTWGGETLAIVGAPSFVEGEEVILFLEWRGDRFAVCGMKQGVYRIGPDQVARRDLSGIVMVSRTGSESAVRHDHPRQDSIPLDDLLPAIRKLVRE